MNELRKLQIFQGVCIYTHIGEGRGGEGEGSLRLNGDALPGLQLCLSRLAGCVVDVQTDVVA